MYISEDSDRMTQLHEGKLPGAVLAVVVSFNDGAAVHRCVHALLHQVDGILIVDNGSSDHDVPLIRELANHAKVSIHWRGRNDGIAIALNTGLKYAEVQNFEWILTMDQDSVAAPDMIRRYAEALQHLPRNVSLAPMLNATKSSRLLELCQKVGYAITSGNMTRTDLMRAAGGFRDELFIDCVDFDFSLKFRALGGEIYVIPAAQMCHQLGQKHNIPKLFSKFYTNHSALRRYYIFRNGLALISWHYRRFPTFCAKFLLGNLFYLVAIILFGPERRDSIRLVIRGCKDYYRGALGPASFLPLSTCVESQSSNNH
jgi:rhamnosyltransferase